MNERERPPTEAVLLSGRFRFIVPPLPASQIQPYASRQSNYSDPHVDGEERNEVKRVAFIGDELPFGEVVHAAKRGEQLACRVPAVQLEEPEPGHEYAGAPNRRCNGQSFL